MRSMRSFICDLLRDVVALVAIQLLQSGLPGSKPAAFGEQSLLGGDRPVVTPLASSGFALRQRQHGTGGCTVRLETALRPTRQRA
jgi:hypothetical protein